MTSGQSFEALFNKWLDPYKAMLAHKRKHLSDEEWVKLIERTKSSINQNPEQYLGYDLPDHHIVKQTIEAIFSDFIEQEKPKNLINK